MTTRWGVYGVQDRSVENGGKLGKPWTIRWRVDGRPHRRSFPQKGHAQTFRDQLMRAQLMGWDADQNGWPIDPNRISGVGDTATHTKPLTFAEYTLNIWWPSVESTLGDKNLIGHRRNRDLAIQILRYADTDHRLDQTMRTPGDSILLSDLTSDDIRAAITARRRINGRTAAVNARRIQAAVTSDHSGDEVVLELRSEHASASTVRNFYVTLGLIVKAAMAGNHVTGNPLEGASASAPKPKPPKVTSRLVPSLDEVFDIADAISHIGPVMPDGRPAGERFRSLILAAGTTGPRPGELVAHRPDWFDWSADESAILFRLTGAAVYDTVSGISGYRERELKHRDEDEFRRIPLLSEVAEAIRIHIDRGYAHNVSLWSSPTGRGRLDWGNIRDTYWRPALIKVFAGTPKASLVAMPPKFLRKAAITWWLEKGISPELAGEWAGHSEEVARLYYVGRSSTSFRRELEMLQKTRAS